MISTQIPKNPIKRLDVFYTLGQGIVISADVQSRTRRDVTHYSRITIDPISLKIVKESCSCEAGSFGKKCWHLKTLEQLMASEEIKEKIEKARSEMLAVEEDIASWG
ncbi:MAG: SWIM zinc finger family protein [Sulfolobus sp.]